MGGPALNPLVEKIRAAHPGTYDDMDDATLTKKVLAKYPQYSDLAVPSTKSMPRPAPPDELKPSTPSERIGERIRQNVYLPVNAIQGTAAEYNEGLTTPKAKAEAQKELGAQAAGFRHMVGADQPTTLGKVAGAVTMGPRMVYEQAKQYIQDPSAFMGDLVTLVPALAEMNFQGLKNKVWTPAEDAARPTLLDPKAQADYTAALDKANQDFNADARVYHDKVTKAFDEAKREHTEAVAKYDTDAAAAAEKHRQAAKDYHDALSKTFDETKRKQLEAAAKYEQERADWVEKSRAHEAARAEAEHNAQKARTLAQSGKDAIKQTFENLKETYRKGRASLDARWTEWNKSIAGIESDPKALYDSIEEAKNKRLRGSPGSLQEFNNLLGELGVQEFEDTPEGRRAIVGQKPVPIETLRTHYSAIVRRIMKGGLPGNVYHALEDVRDVVDKQIVDGLKSRNLPEGVYQTLKSDEHTFLSDWDDRRSPLHNALAQLDPNYLSKKILGVGNEYIVKQLARWRQYGADPTLPAKALQMVNEAKDTAKIKVKVPVDPGPEPVRPAAALPEGKVPERPREPEVVARPEIPQKAVPAAPELKPVERPAAGAQKLGVMSRAAARIVGKLGGAVAGSVVGHPMVGWAAGGELAPEILNRIITSRATKAGAGAVTPADVAALSPVEKTGIQQGITKRLVEAAGKGEPLPPLERFRTVLTPEQMQQVMRAAMKNKAAPSSVAPATATPPAE